MNKNFIYIIIAVIFCNPVFVQCKFFKRASENEKVVTVLGNISNVEQDYLVACFKPFEDETGVKISYESNSNFEALIPVLIENGNPPDVAIFPQPGGAYNLATRGHLVKLDPRTQVNIRTNYADDWVKVMTFNDDLYGVVHSANIKSLVFYPKKAWKKAGWKVPDTWDELKVLCQKMKSAGQVPWSIGIETGATTGWVATDWLEDIMLRSAGADEYDKWVSHETYFQSPAVKKSAEIMGQMWFTDGYVLGGPMAIPTISPYSAPADLFDDPPSAWMHKQGNFIISAFPERIRENLDEEVGFFLLPSINPDYGKPILGGGMIFYAFKNRPEVHDFMHFISTGKSGEAWARTGGALFVHKDQDLSVYPNDLNRKLAEIMMNAETFRYDASDLMPPEVGSNAFWYEMVEYIHGKDIDDVLRDIDSEWP